MRRMAIFCALMLAACTYEPQEAKSITLKLVNTTVEVRDHCGDDGLIEGGVGCAKGSGQTKDGAGDSCTIIALRLRSGYDDRERLATIGHELVHCFKGSVHT